jgi:asparagine synthetase B (glutamine-hydrolysing)
MITNDPEPQEVSKYLALGGPTLSSAQHIDGMLFVHHLLSVTGEVTPQPLIEDGKLFFLLGEVYNYDKSLPSDLYHVVNCYKEHGDEFTSHLDGEYLIVVYDTTKRQIHFFTDIWGTRAAWYEQYGEHFYFGTLPRIEPTPSRFTRPQSKEELFLNHKVRGNATKLSNNSHYIFHIETKTLECVNNELHQWDLKQYKTNYEDWNAAFTNAVLKRHHKNAALLLSGGVDSVAIALCLADHNKYFMSLHFNYKLNNEHEDMETYKQTIDYCWDRNSINAYVLNDYPAPTPQLFDNTMQLNRFKEVGLGESAMLPLVNVAAIYNRKVIMSGQGADDIMTNYMQKKFLADDNFLEWPENLEEHFPYKHFYEGQNELMIERNEFACLTYGMEVRSVFLDKALTQEWLNLDHTLKNKEVKGPLKQFLRDRGIKVPEKIAGLAAQEPWFQDKHKRDEQRAKMGMK